MIHKNGRYRKIFWSDTRKGIVTTLLVRPRALVTVTSCLLSILLLVSGHSTNLVLPSPFGNERQKGPESCQSSMVLTCKGMKALCLLLGVMHSLKTSFSSIVVRIAFTSNEAGKSRSRAKP
uniref:Uncharacterized protein n=1 Tax=Utricularia reniformis TaxID=192314 RepID=A0A1Y0B033_9LAMI|nr:hypothetical protein AEK19_MT0481 [Utricularia reniformis]ART30738.1 hypothetical protein AEK19_MT0481 [Utricularia reniformis]